MNVLNMSEMDRSRLIEAEWQPTDNKGSEKYMAEIQVYANNRTGLLVDLSKIFTERKIDMRSINSRTSKQEKAVSYTHLDVYKGQAVICSFWNFLFFFMIEMLT